MLKIAQKFYINKKLFILIKLNYYINYLLKLFILIN